jgi:predicted Fe-Mo cluster-binding NifX family protein
MKLAVTSKGKDLDAQVDPRFGRAAYILVVNTDSMDVSVLDNSENVNSFKGAGIQAATMVSDQGAQVLLTGFCGPNAYKTLQAAKINVVSDISGTVRDAVQLFMNGKISFSKEANVDGHW